MWPAMASLPPAGQQARLAQFCALFVQLHRLDWRPFVTDPAALAAAGPYMYVDQALRDARWDVEHLGLTGFGPLVDWLAAHRGQAACTQPAVVHRDFHPSNVLLRADDSAVVIDWSGLGVTDPRFDLAWTVLLAQSHAGEALSRTILSEYERASGTAVVGLDYFEVFACARRLADVTVSLTQGAERMGMRPEAVALMRAQLPAVARVAQRLETLTGRRLPEVEALLAQQRG
jgi:aminoglycoside phosphotransferase (APT) family kinase protein